jgi:type III secretory pathway lipoprotein EscJ
MEKGWKEVYSTVKEYRAEIAKDLLENEGIKVVLINQHDSAYQVFGEISLYVEEHNFSQAVELLKNLKKEEGE